MFLGCKDNKKTGEGEKGRKPPTGSPLHLPHEGECSAATGLGFGTQSPKSISDWSDRSDQSYLSDLQYNKAVS